MSSTLFSSTLFSSSFSSHLHLLLFFSYSSSSPTPPLLLLLFSFFFFFFVNVVTVVFSAAIFLFIEFIRFFYFNFFVVVIFSSSSLSSFPSSTSSFLGRRRRLLPRFYLFPLFPLSVIFVFFLFSLFSTSFPLLFPSASSSSSSSSIRLYQLKYDYLLLPVQIPPSSSLSFFSELFETSHTPSTDATKTWRIFFSIYINKCLYRTQYAIVIICLTLNSFSRENKNEKFPSKEKIQIFQGHRFTINPQWLST